MSRRLRKDADLSRRRPVRAAYERALLLFEDSVVAPDYFKDLRRAFGLHPANVVIPDQFHGNDPVSVVRAGLKAAKAKGEDAFDRVYCLVDRDRHANFEAARSLARNDPQGQSGRLCLIVSDPCFEVWILAHFTNSTRAMKAASVPAGSDCGEVVAAIRREHWPSYEKGQANLYAGTSRYLAEARANALGWKRHHEGSRGDGNPSTDIFLLVEYLEKLKRS